MDDKTLIIEQEGGFRIEATIHDDVESSHMCEVSIYDNMPEPRISRTRMVGSSMLHVLSSATSAVVAKLSDHTVDVKTIIESILERYGNAYYFKFKYGNIDNGTIECVMNNGTDDDFQIEGYKFHVEHHDQRNIDDDNTDPETNGGIIDVPTHDIYTISYKKITMIQRFLLIGYVEQELISEAYINQHGGLDTDESHFVVGKLYGTFDTYDKAHAEMMSIIELPELGFEIKQIFTMK